MITPAPLVITIDRFSFRDHLESLESGLESGVDPCPYLRCDRSSTSLYLTLTGYLDAHARPFTFHALIITFLGVAIDTYLGIHGVQMQIEPIFHARRQWTAV